MQAHVCVWRGGWGEVGDVFVGCPVSVSMPMCVFVLVICMDARRFSLFLRSKIKS